MHYPDPAAAPYPPPPGQAPGMLHHSHSQPLYDPAVAAAPTYDHYTPGPPITTQQPEGGIYMPDARMMSPPPLIQQSSDAYLYADGQAQGTYDPPRGYSPYPGQGMPGGYTPQGDDTMADEPLLARRGSHADARYGNPFSGGGGDEGDLADGQQRQQAEDDEPVTLRYGAAPEGRMIRRLKTTKRVP